ncbi:YwqJ-related putative deaminase [Nocardia sp. NBC_01388]|uniref:WXG100-like domain-containing protein n=1 Tax=Nocardia sp. NBC_01388 TaxID=2903596 RepID=UPI00324802CC
MGWTTAVGDFFPGWLMTGLNFGMAYPKGDQDELFALGDAWKHAAAELEKLEPTLKGITDQVPKHYVGDGATAATAAFATFFDGEHSIPKLIEGMQALGHDARSTATEIEFAKIQSEIFAVMTLWTVTSLMSSLVGSTAVPAYLLAARGVLAKFAAEVADRISAIMLESGLKELAAPLVREVIVPLGERVAPLGEKLTAAGEKLAAGGNKWRALNQTIADSGPLVRYPVAALKGGMMGAGLDAGSQVVQIMENHRDDGFNLKQTFQTAIQWGAGGALGGPGHDIMTKLLKDQKQLPKWLGGTLTGGVGGLAGAGGMYGAGLGTQLYDNKGDWNKVDKSFSPQLLIGGLAMGTMGGGGHGLGEQNRIDQAAKLEADTNQAPVEPAAVTKADSPQAIDAPQKPSDEQVIHPQPGDAVQQGDGHRPNSPGQESIPNNGQANAPEHRGGQPNSDSRNGAGDTNRPSAEAAKPADAAAKPSDSGARPAAVNDRPGEAQAPKDGATPRPAADNSARVANAAPADQKANFVAGAQDKPVQGPGARAPEVRAPEVQAAAPRPEALPARSEAAVQPSIVRTNDVVAPRPEASPAPEGLRPDQKSDDAPPIRPAPSDNAPRTDPPADRDLNQARPNTATTKPETNTRTPDKDSKDPAADSDQHDANPASDQPVAPFPYIEPAEGPRAAPSRNIEDGSRRDNQPRAAADEHSDERSSEHPRKSDPQSPESEAHPVEAHPHEGDWSPRPDDDWSRMSSQEISDELSRRWGVETVGFDNPNVQPEVLREFARAVDDMLSRYPDVDLPKVVIEPMPEENYAEAVAWVRPDGRVDTEKLALNELHALDPETLAHTIADDEASGHFVRGSGDRPIHSTLVHEFGHAIDFESQGRAGDTAEQALENYYKSTRGGVDEAAFDKWLNQLSDYSFHEDGKFDAAEALAEAFTDVEYNGEGATEPAKVLYWHLLDSANQHSTAPNGFTHLPEDRIARPNGPDASAHNAGEPNHPETAAPAAKLTAELHQGFDDLRGNVLKIIEAHNDPARSDELSELREEFANRVDDLGLGDPDIWQKFVEHDSGMAEYLANYGDELLPPAEEAPAHVETHSPAETETPHPDEAKSESPAPEQSADESGHHPDLDPQSTPHPKDTLQQIRERINDIFAASHDPARASELPELRARIGELFDEFGLRDLETGATAWQSFKDRDATLAQYIEQNYKHLLPRPEDLAESHVEPHSKPSEHESAEEQHNEHPKDEPHPDTPDTQLHNEIPEAEPATEPTADEQGALHRYTDPDADVYSDLNNRLRNGLELSPEQHRLVSDMVSGLEKMPTYDGTVWRGTHLSKEEIARYIEGETVPESSFTSTSRDPRRIFTSNVEFIIHSETGRDISALSARPGEKEVLFKPGTNFEVRGVVRDPDAGLFGVTRIYLYESAEPAPIHETPADHTGHEGQPGDHSSTPGGDVHPSEELPVRHGSDRTALGDSPEVQRVFDNVRNEGEHDVVIHGDRFGKPTTNGNFEVDPQQVVEAIRSNPDYVEGTPVRLLSCHSGNDIGWAQHIANELSVPVRAPSDLVGVRALPDSPATLHNTAEWRTFQPAEADGTTPQPAVHKPIDQPEGQLPKYEEDSRENWDILGDEKTGDETTPASDRSPEDKPATEPAEPTSDPPRTSEVPKPPMSEEELASERPAPSEERAPERSNDTTEPPHPRDIDRPAIEEPRPEQGPRQDLPADGQPARDVEQQPRQDEAPIRNDKEQPRTTEGLEAERAPEREQQPNDNKSEALNKPGPDPQQQETTPAEPRDEPPKHRNEVDSDPTAATHQPTPEENTHTRHDDEDGIPRPVTEDELLNQRGMPVANQRAFQRICEEFNYVMDVRPTTPSAVRWLEEGAMPKPKPIKAKSINEFDVYLGAPEDKIGLVGFFEPEMPAKAEVPPELWDKVNSRYTERLNEWNRDGEKMAKFADKREFFVEDKVVYAYDKDTGEPRPLTGDHDLFDIRKPNGDRLSLEEVTEVTNRMIDENMGVMHGPHRYWPEMDPPVNEDIYQKIVNSHGPGGEPLIRFSPDAGPILIDSSIPVPHTVDNATQPEIDAPAELPHDTSLEPTNAPSEHDKPFTLPEDSSAPLTPDAKQTSAPEAEQHQEHVQPNSEEAPAVDEPAHSPTEIESGDHTHPGKETEAGASFHPDDEVLSNLADQVPKDPDHFTADVHIDENGNARIGDRTYTPEEFGDLLHHNGWDGETPIRLIGCDAATNGFAARLAAHLDVDVLAPTKPAWTDHQGRLYTSTAESHPDGTRRPRIPPDGEWETHHPDGSKTTATDDGFAPGTHDTDKHDIKPNEARDRAGSADASEPRGEPLEPQPPWHGSAAGEMRHYRLPVEDISTLNPDEQVAALKYRAHELADDALKPPMTAAEADAANRLNVPKGQTKIKDGCAGTLLHDGLLTAHTSMTKLGNHVTPDTHPVIQHLLDEIKAGRDAGRIDKIGMGHGKCAEIALISDRLAKLEDSGARISSLAAAKAFLEGAQIHTRTVGELIQRRTGIVLRRHNEYIPPCDTCKHVLPQLGIDPI